jgi:DNA polymerase III subunit delta
LLDELNAVSLFGGKKIILVSQAFFFLSPGRGKKDAEKMDPAIHDGLLSYFRNPDPLIDIAFVVPGEISDKSDLIKALKACPCATLNAVAAPSPDDFVDFALSAAVKEGKSITSEAARLLSDRCGGDYLLFRNNLEKLLTYTDAVRPDDVRALVYEPLEDNVFAIVSDVLSRQTAKALKIYSDCRSGGMDPLSLLPAFVSQFRFMALAKYLIEKGENDAAIASELSGKGTVVRPARLYYTRKETTGLSFWNLVGILDDLALIEQDIKLKADDPDQRLQLFLATFTVRYLPQA